MAQIIRYANNSTNRKALFAQSKLADSSMQKTDTSALHDKSGLIVGAEIFLVAYVLFPLIKDLIIRLDENTAFLWLFSLPFSFCISVVFGYIVRKRLVELKEKNLRRGLKIFLGIVVYFLAIETLKLWQKI